MSSFEKELVFVYNANTGFFNKLVDFSHKSLSPKTYSCSLCQLTYGNFKVYPEWRSFIESMDLKVSFVYKNKFNNNFIEVKKPLVLLKENNEFRILLDSNELSQFENVFELIKTLQKVLK